jgi:hypothetical protein
VTLTFSSFSIEGLGGSGQVYDFMEFYDGPNTASPQIGGTYTGNNSPGTVTASSGTLTIYFHSDNATAGDGWMANWTCEGQNPTGNPTLPNPIIMGDGVVVGDLDCGLSYHSFYDSGNSTSNYSDDESYTQTICNPNPDQSVRLSFMPLPSLSRHLDLQASLTGNDYIYIYDGPDNTGNLIGTYTGGTLSYPQPGTYVSAGSCLTVEFSSDLAANGQGWSARAYCENRPSHVTYNNVGCTSCSPVTFKDTGGDASNYGDNENYIVTYCPDAEAPAGEVVWADFSAGSVGIERNWDYLYVFDGDSTSSRCIGVYTGDAGFTNNLGVIKATEDNPTGCLTFQFFSDMATTASGWSANMVTGPPRRTFGGDECTEAAEVTEWDVVYAGSNMQATGTPGIIDPSLSISSGLLPECSGSTAITRLENTVWYKFSSPVDFCEENTMNLLLENIACQNESSGGATMQMVLYEHSTCQAGSAWGPPLYCYDQMPNGIPVDLTPYLLAGTDYYLMFDGFAGQHCNFDLSLSLGGECPPDCTPTTPVDLGFEVLSDTSARLYWSEEGTQYRLRYRIKGTVDWTFLQVFDNQITLNGLTPGTFYEFRVQTNCDGVLSDASVFKRWEQTLCQSPAYESIVFTLDPCSPRNVLVSWTPPANVVVDRYKIIYRSDSDPAGVWQAKYTPSDGGATTEKLLNQLDLATNYKVRVKTWCASGEKSYLYNGFAEFTTLANNSGCRLGLDNEDVRLFPNPLILQTEAGSVTKKFALVR